MGAIGDAQATDPIVEHAIEYSGGSMLVRPCDKGIEPVYPLAKWIEHNQRDGGRVWRRRVQVIEDWTLVPPGATA